MVTPSNLSPEYKKAVVKRSSRESKERNKEKVAEQQRRWYEKNREKQKAASKKYKEENRERVREVDRLRRKYGPRGSFRKVWKAILKIEAMAKSRQLRREIAYYQADQIAKLYLLRKILRLGP